MKIIAIASAKGGVGKTTVTANLGAALAEFDKQVLLLDGNVTGANLGLHFGLNYTPFTIADKIGDKKVNISQIIYAHQSGVRIIPAPLSNKKVDLRKLKSFVDAIEGAYDFVLVDSSPTLGKEALTAIDLCEEILAVTTPDLPAVVSCKKTIDLAQRLGKKIGGVVLNRVRGEKYEMTTREVESMLDTPIISIIPESEEIQKSITLQQPLVLQKPNYHVSIEFKKLAARIAGEVYRPSNLLYNFRKFFEFILHREKEVEQFEQKEIEGREMERMRAEENSIKKKLFEEKPSKKKQFIEEIIEEVVDVEELEKELKEELKGELKRNIKKQIIKKLRESYEEVS